MSQRWTVPLLLSGACSPAAWPRSPGNASPSADVEALRARWLRGHLVRTVVALADQLSGEVGPVVLVNTFRVDR